MVPLEGKDPSEIGFERFTRNMKIAEEMTPSKLLKTRLDLV